ncbi:cytochrome o ubiquinol oxidase subunit IV [Bartonella sp. TP]|uniref:cytochrome o ubiquinol oxidase subunit IV n=1 Tax=Bartonella sp. TP TaxID=3057550 RepID=UPI0025B18696|nr:cytochrome o ubiquinol oxidase subunit IV [Bartonella sp. TP]MDN5249224.1 cytochrome o ubiquinol oxidase subunit IV [Alphaproteobacteria bacterium]WJW80412.1 cytochrome o ubiquinol oxidase subunit IV [Bartonella sp. TP]
MNKQKTEHGVTISGYLLGFILAVLLTLLSFIPVLKDLFHQWTASSKIMYLLGLAIIQMLVQVFYFLHLNEGPDAKWNLGTFGFGVVCVTIIIGGTWWAIQHLNYNMMGGSGRIVTPPVINNMVTNTPHQVIIENKTTTIQTQQPAVPATKIEKITVTTTTTNNGPAAGR